LALKKPIGKVLHGKINVPMDNALSAEIAPGQLPLSKPVSTLPAMASLAAATHLRHHTNPDLDGVTYNRRCPCHTGRTV
jgi:hypothetical protein